MDCVIPPLALRKIGHHFRIVARVNVRAACGKEITRMQAYMYHSQGLT
jgi:hypothetical protein